MMTTQTERSKEKVEIFVVVYTQKGSWGESVEFDGSAFVDRDRAQEYCDGQNAEDPDFKHFVERISLVDAQ